MKVNQNLKTQLIFLVFLFLTSMFSAQNEKSNDWKFGIKGGINRSNIRAIDNVGEKSGYLGTELYGGFVSEYHFNDKNAFQGSLLASYTEAVTFIEVPFYYKYKFTDKISVFIGPKLGYIPDPQGNYFHYFPNRFGFSTDIGVDYRLLKNFYIESSFSKGFSKQINDNILEYYDGKRDVYRLGLVFFIK